MPIDCPILTAAAKKQKFLFKKTAWIIEMRRVRSKTGNPANHDQTDRNLITGADVKTPREHLRFTQFAKWCR
jgi:hypothetical protein